MQAIPADIQHLIILIKEGKKEGFDLLYKKYAGCLYGVLYKATGDKHAAENILGLTFVNTFRRIHEYNGSSTFFIWMLQMAQSVLRENGMAAGSIKNERLLANMILDRQECDGLLKEEIGVEIIKRESRSRLKSFR
jgi:hypothetical protein